MSFSKVSYFSPKLWSKGVLDFKQPLICLTLSLGFVASGFSVSPARAAKAPVFKEWGQISVEIKAPVLKHWDQSSVATKAPVLKYWGQTSAANIRSPIPDGIYLYGQSPEPEQLGSTYLIFEVKNQQTVGAFYLPSSSFDCFHGELQPDRLLLTVVDSFDQTTHPYAVALQADQPVAAGGGATPPVSLVGYHPIEFISAMDYQLLSTCQANYQPQLNDQQPFEL